MVNRSVAIVVSTEVIGSGIVRITVRCPWCSRLHRHGWPGAGGERSAPCGTPRRYDIIVPGTAPTVEAP
jgi:hypothetical protein